MADTNDTIDGLLAEFRGYSAGMPPSYHVTMSWHDFRVMLGRLEAAHKRERGNAAELREALVRVLDWLKRMNAQPLNTLAVSELTPSYAVNRTAKSIIEDNDYHISQLTAALSTPPRNCDCFKTAAEAIDAYQDLTGDQLATDSGMKEWVEFAVWLFAPATEKEGGNDAD